MTSGGEGRRGPASGRAAGVSADEVIGEGMLHDYPLALPKLAESQRAWRAIAEFCRAPGEAAQAGPSAVVGQLT